MWKRREACSKAVLIGRGLDQADLVWWYAFPLFDFEGAWQIVPQAHLLGIQPKAGCPPTCAISSVGRAADS